MTQLERSASFPSLVVPLIETYIRERVLRKRHYSESNKDE